MSDTSRALSALNHIDPSCPRDEWVRIGMAAKAAGLSFEDFHNWSKQGLNYKDEKDCRAVWNSFDEPGGIGAGTLFYIASEKGWKESKTSAQFKESDNQNHKHQNKNSSENFNVKKLTAIEIWERCLFAESTHKYIQRKQGLPDGLRYYPETEIPLIVFGKDVRGYLAAPCWNIDVLETIQFISPVEGEKKLNLTGFSFDYGYFTVGVISDRIYIVESLGNAWAVQKSISIAAVVCFGSGRMLKVARILRERYPTACLIIVADRAKEKEASEIAKAVCGLWIELPQDKPENYDVNDYAKDHGYEALANLLVDIKIPELRYKLLTVDDLYNARPMFWIVKGLIPKTGLAALYGPSSSGKSFLLLDMALTIATGEAFWFGRRICAVPITYICLEGELGFGKRVKAWFTYTNKALPKSIRFITQPFNLLTDDVNELFQALVLAGHTGGMIILDTLNRAAPGADENSPVDMGKIISSSSKLQRLTGGMVLLAHHTGKDETKKMRGHTSLPAALDGAIEVMKTGVGRQWTVAKSKDDKDGDTYPFKLEVVPLGVDEDGDAITSCVVDFDSSSSANELRRVIPLKAGNQKIVWDAMNRLLASSKEHSKGGAPLNRPCVRLDDAVSQLHGCLSCESKRQTERIRYAITGLTSRGLLALQDGWIWTV